MPCVSIDEVIKIIIKVLNIYFPFFVRGQLRYKNGTTHCNTNQNGEVLLQGFRFFFRDIQIIYQTGYFELAEFSAS